MRAPIPQKQDILVEPEPLFGGITLLLFLFYLMLIDLKLNNWLLCFCHLLNVTVDVSVKHAVPKRRRPARSIFDGFRDFQTETSE